VHDAGLGQAQRRMSVAARQSGAGKRRAVAATGGLCGGGGRCGRTARWKWLQRTRVRKCSAGVGKVRGRLTRPVRKPRGVCFHGLIFSLCHIGCLDTNLEY
jgi:hypothetical protein